MARPDRLEGQAWIRASKSFQKALLDVVPKYENAAVQLFSLDAEIFLEGIGGGAKGINKGDFVSRDEGVPYYTGNLMDSIGVRILKGNTIRAYRVMSDVTGTHATKPQTMKGLRDIWGYLEIMQRIERPSRRSGTGLVAQLMVGVPYAQEVDWKDEYFQPLSEKFVANLGDTMKYLEKYKVVVK